MDLFMSQAPIIGVIETTRKWKSWIQGIEGIETRKKGNVEFRVFLCPKLTVLIETISRQIIQSRNPVVTHTCSDSC